MCERWGRSFLLPGIRMLAKRSSYMTEREKKEKEEEGEKEKEIEKN